MLKDVKDRAVAPGGYLGVRHCPQELILGDDPGGTFTYTVVIRAQQRH